MTLKNVLKMSIATLAVVGTMTMITPNAAAQPPGGGGGMPPEMMAKFKAWGKWREQHKNISTLQDMMFQVREVDKEATTKFDKKQAASLLKILKEWRNKPTMTDDQAKAVSKQVASVMTEKQLKKMATVVPPGRGGRGGGMGGGRPGGGGGAPGGRPGGPGGGGFKFPDPPKGGYNPLNPDTSPFEQFRPMMKKSMDDFTTALSARK